MSEKRMGETKERLEQIFRDYYQLIYRVAFSQVKNHADAEDITQEVFLRLSGMICVIRIWSMSGHGLSV